MKICTKCNLRKSRKDFPKNNKSSDGRNQPCKECKNQNQHKYYSSPKGKTYLNDYIKSGKAKINATKYRNINPIKVKKSKIKHLLKAKLENKLYQDLFKKQNGRCAICNTDKPGGSGDFHIDHNHSCCPNKNGCVKCTRGLLCFKCNVGLGLFNDDSLIVYKASIYLGKEVI